MGSSLPATAASYVILIVKMVDTVYRVVDRAVGVVLSKGVVPDVKLRGRPWE